MLQTLRVQVVFAVFWERYFITDFNRSLPCSRPPGPSKGVAYFPWKLGACFAGNPSECEAGSCLVNSWHTNGDCYVEEASCLNPKPEIVFREPDPRTIEVMGGLCLCCLVLFSLLPLLFLHH